MAQLKHSVLPLFGDEFGFRVFADLCVRAKIPVGLSLADTLVWLVKRIRSDDDLVANFRRAYPTFSGSANAVTRLMHVYAPAVALGVCARGPSLFEALHEFQAFNRVLPILRVTLTEPELHALRMLMFNQLTTPAIIRMVGQEKLFSERDQEALARTYGQWAAFNHVNYRSGLEQLVTFSGRKENHLRWTMMNWVVYQPVRLHGENPLMWGRSFDYSNQPIFRAFQPLLHDFTFVATAFSPKSLLGPERADASKHLGPHVSLAIEALAPFGLDGEQSMAEYFNEKACLRTDDLQPRGRLGPTPLRVKALLKIFEAWKVEYEKDFAYEYKPALSAQRIPGFVSETREDGFYLDLSEAFTPVTPGDHFGLTSLVSFLLERRLARMHEYFKALYTKEDLDLHRTQEVATACSREGFLPVGLAGASSRAQGPYMNGYFWASILAKGQNDFPENRREELMRYMGRLVFFHGLDTEMLAVVPREDHQAIHGALWAELEKLSVEANLQNVRVEQVFLSAALKVALSERFPRFGLAEAYCLAFRMGMGSTHSSVGDFTKAHYDAVSSQFTKAPMPSFGFLEGSSGVYVSLFSQWRRALKEKGLSDSDMKRVFDLPPELLAGFGENVQLGSLLGKPAFWKSMLDETHLKRCFAGFQTGLLEDYVKKNPIVMGKEGPLQPTLVQYLDGISGRIRATGLAFTKDNLRLARLSDRNSEFIASGVRALSPQFDLLSKLVNEKSMRAITLPEMFETLLRLTDSPLSLQTHGRADDFRAAFDRIYGDLLANHPNLSLGSLDLRFEDCALGAGIGNAAFLDWLVKLDEAGHAGFYQVLAQAPSVEASAKVMKLVQEELQVPVGAVQSLYRAHHALTLLRNGKTEGYELPEVITRQMDYLRQRTSLYLMSARTKVSVEQAPNRNLRTELAQNYAALAEQLGALGPEVAQDLHRSMQASYLDRLRAGLVVKSGELIGERYDLQKTTRVETQKTRNKSLVCLMYSQLRAFADHLPEKTVGCLSLTNRFLPLSVDEVQEVANSLLHPNPGMELSAPEISSETPLRV